jgi:hypothetical protein
LTEKNVSRHKYPLHRLRLHTCAIGGPEPNQSFYIKYIYIYIFNVKGLLIFLFVSFTTNLLACDCKTISKENDYNLSDFVFLGQVIEINDHSFKVYVQEVFKGDAVKSVQVFTDDCSIYPKRGEFWLMYSTKREDGYFYVSQCGWSRSFNNPFSVNSKNLPDPPIIGGQPNNTLNIQAALYEMQQDILSLRDIKDKKEKTNIIERFSFYILFIFLFLGLTILFLYKLRN